MRTFVSLAIAFSLVGLLTCVPALAGRPDDPGPPAVVPVGPPDDANPEGPPDGKPLGPPEDVDPEGPPAELPAGPPTNLPDPQGPPDTVPPSPPQDTPLGPPDDVPPQDPPAGLPVGPPEDVPPGPPDLNAFGLSDDILPGLLAAFEHVPADSVAELVLTQLTDDPPLSGQDLADAIHEHLGISLGADAAAGGLYLEGQTVVAGPTIAQVPEPGTLSLLTLGTLALLRRRKK